MSGLIGSLTAAVGGSFGELADAAARFGYWAVLLVVAGDGVFPLFPGETAIVAAAVLAADGTLSLPLVIAAGAVGAVIGDSTAYWTGRRGRGPIRRGVVKVAGAGRIEAAERMVARQGAALVLAGRFLPGIRIAINLSCGAGQMSYRRFLLFDSVGAVLWSTQAALIGYFAGKAFADKPWVAFGVAFAVMAAVGAVIGVRERRHVRRQRAAASSEKEPATPS
ncbi:DedA family protein [Miltoncostaea oceani]|uniref:DedA family protein n=1 Tax=Miltoncostaea oceani TaxID=2843216 RepID=UPI001C3C802B|nr:DedA family protein [Miltoncostaea oceani]